MFDATKQIQTYYKIPNHEEWMANTLFSPVTLQKKVKQGLSDAQAPVSASNSMLLFISYTKH